MPARTRDKLIAPRISELTEISIPNITANRRRIIDIFIFNFPLSLKLSNYNRQLYFNIIRRCEASFEEYCLARESLLKHISDNNTTVKYYLAALRHFEQCFYQLSQLIDLGNAVRKEKEFQPGDGSVGERIWILNSWSKHLDRKFSDSVHAESRSFELFAEKKKSGSEKAEPHFSDTSNVPIWLTNNSIDCKETSISYTELSEFIMFYYEDAQKLAVVDANKS